MRYCFFIVFLHTLQGRSEDQVLAVFNVSSPGSFEDETRHQIQNVPLMRLTRDLLARDRYDVRVRPVLDHTHILKVHLSMSLYQIIEVDEPAQNIKLNVWMIQKWKDEYLDWDPSDYDEINNIIIPHKHVWVPDTYLYNSVKMSREETERYMNIQVNNLRSKGENGSLMSFLYPAIYTITCRLNIRFFPYDRQNCTLTISSWTNSKSALDYYADIDVNFANFIPNEEWDVMSFKIYRHEYKYACCEEPWVILQASLVIQRKSLYYIVNLILPTSIITIVAITGFFTPASTDDDRTEKINLGITTLLAMSILMLMVSDQMPTTSEFVPLIAWFYLSIIIIVSIGTFLTSVVLSIQGRRQYGQNPPLFIRYYFLVVLPNCIFVSVPPALRKLWSEQDDDPYNVWKRRSASPTLMTREQSRKSQAGVNSLQIPNSVTDRQNSIMMIDVSAPTSPVMRPSRTASESTEKKVPSLWDGTMSALAGTNANLRRTSAAFAREMDGMRRKRQCSLEWEFLATVLDRFLLIVFISAVILITGGLVVVGRMAQYDYDHPPETYNNME